MSVAPNYASTVVESSNVFRKKVSLFGKKRNPPKDCDGHNTEGAVSGVYSLLIDGKSVKVFCDFDSESGRPWTVFQKRKDGSVDFYRGSAE